MEISSNSLNSFHLKCSNYIVTWTKCFQFLKFENTQYPVKKRRTQTGLTSLPQTKEHISIWDMIWVSKGFFLLVIPSLFRQNMWKSRDSCLQGAWCTRSPGLTDQRWPGSVAECGWGQKQTWIKLRSEQRLQPEFFTSRSFPWLLEKIKGYYKKCSGFEFRSNSGMTKAAFLGKLITDSNYFFFVCCTSESMKRRKHRTRKRMRNVLGKKRYYFSSIQLLDKQGTWDKWSRGKLLRNLLSSRKYSCLRVLEIL